MYGRSKERKVRGDRKKKKVMGGEGMALRKALYTFGSREQKILSSAHMMLSPTDNTQAPGTISIEKGQICRGQLQDICQSSLKSTNSVSLD